MRASLFCFFLLLQKETFEFCQPAQAETRGGNTQHDHPPSCRRIVLPQHTQHALKRGLLKTSVCQPCKPLGIRRSGLLLRLLMASSAGDCCFVAEEGGAGSRLV